MKADKASGVLKQQGIALVELTMVLPLILLLLAVIIDFGRVFYEVGLLQGRVNSAARYLAVHAPVSQKGCPAHGGPVYCLIAEKLVLYATPDLQVDNPPGSPHRFMVDQLQVYEKDHWQVSATYRAEFMLSGLLPDEVASLNIRLHAIQRSFSGN